MSFYSFNSSSKDIKTSLLKKIHIDSDITKAETLPADFYKSQEVFELLKEKVFISSWQWLGDKSIFTTENESVYPFVFLENYIDEPLICVRNQDKSIKCFTNVCTHRGNILCHEPGSVKDLRCM